MAVQLGYVPQGVGPLQVHISVPGHDVPQAGSVQELPTQVLDAQLQLGTVQLVGVLPAFPHEEKLIVLLLLFVAVQQNPVVSAEHE
jgi:hypothetical protein